ncbi:biotin transporter BioY [Gemmiger formicilis]|uniref:biotin transporter BioY n=1 Tax=Gemmiger formicilis TaxID=745368 RepID=UPI001959A6D7|nr:biotin transporter BioY [Gemmiger formicilis]MBM6914001.1 biotin transporter BioY [Gemmiger formicilis]
MKTANKTRQLTTAALCAALLCVVSPWSIVIGPISLTLAVFGVFFAGAMLASPGMAAAAVLVYMALGAVGLPVFSNNMGGAQVLVGVTAGFLWAYPVMAAILAAACRRWQGLLPRLGAVLLGQLVCYTLGTVWFMFVMKMGLLPSLTACVFPFILPDFLKGLAAVLLARGLRARLG